MSESDRRWLVVVIAVGVCFGLAACSGESREGAERADEPAVAETAGEHTVAEVGEGAGDHARSEGGEGEHGRSERGGEEAEGEHGGEDGHNEEGEEGGESGVYIGKAETWDYTRRGARLVMKYEAAANAFVGTVENTTEQTLCAVRVEVHLSTRVELGPSERTDVAPGGKVDVQLPDEGQAFDTWTAHPEMANCSGG